MNNHSILRFFGVAVGMALTVCSAFSADEVPVHKAGEVPGCEGGRRLIAPEGPGGSFLNAISTSLPAGALSASNGIFAL